jgi:hypothetical protein
MPPGRVVSALGRQILARRPLEQQPGWEGHAPVMDGLVEAGCGIALLERR